jgi:hypothetical protein
MSFREKLAQRSRERYSELAANDNIGGNGFTGDNLNGEPLVVSDYFGLDNVKKFPPCIDLRLADGSFRAIPYSYIMEISFEPSEGIEVITTTKKITITGRNLHKLYDYLTAYRVRFIKAHVGNDTADEDALVITRIRIEEI